VSCLVGVKPAVYNCLVLARDYLGMGLHVAEFLRAGWLHFISLNKGVTVLKLTAVISFSKKTIYWTYSILYLPLD